jgi:hypothetical protein
MHCTPVRLCVLTLAACLAAGAAFAPAPAQAALVAGPDIIPAPASVINNPPGATNDHQQGFNERQGVLLAAPITTDSGVIPAGTWVDSHMIFLNIEGTTLTSDENETWTFDGQVLGVMSDGTGSLEVASTPVLGAAGTTYPAAPFAARGMEANDGYTVSGNQIIVSMHVTQPGDWIRVVTAVREVSLDLHPTSCPNPLSVNKKGVIPAALLGTADFDVSQIDPSTLLLEGVAPKRWSIDDMATPYDGDLCGCTTDGPDGYADLTLKFYAPDVLAAISPVAPGDVVTLTLTGMLTDGTPFIAQDCMKIVGNFAGPDESLLPVPAAPDRGSRLNGDQGDGSVQPVTWGTLKSRYDQN